MPKMQLVCYGCGVQTSLGMPDNVSRQCSWCNGNMTAELWYSQKEYEKLENVLKELREWVQNHDCFLDNNEE
jgi:hypothetical protein